MDPFLARNLSLFYGPLINPPDVFSNKNLLEKYFAEADKSLKLLLEPKYDKIKKVFIKYNTRLLSSASAERLFSLAKHILTYARTSLLDDNFEMLTILNASRKKGMVIKTK